MVKVRPRSVIPGRQRWDVDVLQRRPHLAERLEVRLQGQPGVREVRASPVTSRLLVLHDPALSPEEVAKLVRQAVTSVALPHPSTAIASSLAEADNGLVARGDPAATAVPLAGGAGVAVVVGWALLRSPLMRLGAVLVVTVEVLRRAWRTSKRAQQPAAASVRSNLHPIMEIVGPHRLQFYWASTLSVVGQFLGMLQIVFIGLMVVVLITGQSAILGALGLVTAPSQLWFLAGATALVCIADSAVSYMSSLRWRELAQAVQHEWRSETYAHVQRVELHYLEGERTSRLARILTDDIDRFGTFFASYPDYFLRISTGLAVQVLVYLILAPGIAWIAFLPVPIIAWISFVHQEHALPDHAANAEAGSALNGQLINTLQASATVKSFGTEDYEINRVRRLSERYWQSNRRIDSRSTSNTQIVRATALGSLAGTLLLGGLEVVAGKLSFEVFSPVAGLPQMVHFQLPRLGDAVADYHRTVAALGRVLELRELPVESDETGRNLDVAQATGEMALEGVTFGYPGRAPVLRDLSLHIAARKTTGIVGATGAGKTTIAKLLLRFHDVGAGRVRFDDWDVRDLRLKDLRSAIGFVGQDAFLFDGTVEENIRYGSFDADFEDVARAARLAEAYGFIEALPERYQTMVGERGVTLSGGQKQRISLARAILKSAPILILDEATSAVDNETEATIRDALRDFARDRTLVVIAHRLSTIRHADRIYVMGDGGAVVEVGTHDELLGRDGAYASLWRLQISEAS